MKKLLGILFVGLILLTSVNITWALTLTEIKEKGILKVGIFPEVSPFTFRDDAGNFAGFDVDVIVKIAQMWNVDIEWVPITEWADNIPGLQTRRYDIFIAPFTISPSRASKILFSQPHFRAGQVIVTRSNDLRINGIDDLDNQRVAVLAGSTCEEALERKVPGAIPVTLPTQREVVNNVLRRKSAAYIVDRPVALAEVKDSRGKLRIVGDPFTIEFYGYGLNKADTGLVAELNQAISLMQEQGEWDKIFNKWFD